MELPPFEANLEWSEVVVFTLSRLNEKKEEGKDEEKMFFVLQKGKTKWEVLLPKECVNLRGYRCLQLQFPVSLPFPLKKLPEEDKDFLQKLFETYSQTPIDGKFLRKLGLTGVPLTENRFADAEILKYLTVKDLMPLRYEFPYYLLLKMQEELKEKYQIDFGSLKDDDTYKIYYTLKKELIRGTIQIFIKENRLEIIQCLLKSSLKRHFLRQDIVNAARLGHVEIFTLFLEANFFLTSKEVDSFLSGTSVDEEKTLFILQLFFQKEIYPTSIGINGAIKKGYLKIVTLLLEKKIYPDFDGVSYAVEGEHLHILRALVKAGLVVKPNTSNIVRKGNLELIRFLLDNKVFLFISEVFEWGDLEMLKLFCEYDYQQYINERDLNNCIERGKFDMVKFLGEKDILPNPWGLYLAIRDNQFKIVKYLMKKGIVPTEEQINCATMTGNLEMVEFLLEKGYSFNKDYIKDAVSKGYIEIVKLFLSKGYKFESKDVDTAYLKGEKEILTLLLEKGYTPSPEVMEKMKEEK